MKTATVVVKTDPQVKRRVQELAAAAGLTLSDLVNVRLREYAEADSVSVSVVPRISKKLERTIAKAERELAQGKIRVAHSVKEFIQELNA